jgi:tripartite-type tricarboxylate transporter receptor subunit TctC
MKCDLAPRAATVVAAVRRRATFGALGVATAFLACAPCPAAAADAWPSRPIRMVVPFPPGGATDIVARTVAIKLAAALSQQVVIDNKPGAGGTIGADVVAKAAPDGYTILMSTSSTHSIGPVVNPKLPYDAFRDFAAVAHVANAPSALVVGRSFPANTVGELVALLRANPGRYNFGSSGIGTYPHLSAEMFKWRAGGLYVVHIPYRGTQLVIPDLVTGQIAFLMDSIVSAQPHIRDGKVKALAVSGAKRSSSLPSVPTFTEAGIRGMELSNWFGVLAPAGTPPEIVQRLNRELNAIIRSPDVVERFANAGAEPAGGTPEQFAKLYRDEYESWKDVIRHTKIKLD